MQELCACSVRLLDTDHVAWVSRGRPCCSGACYAKAEKRDELKLRARRDDTTRTITLYPAHAFDVVI